MKIVVGMSMRERARAAERPAGPLPRIRTSVMWEVMLFDVGWVVSVQRKGK